MTKLSRDGYFLSATNPLATAAQRDIEALALRLVHFPAAEAGRRRAEARVRAIVGSDGTAEAWKRFDDFLEEWAFSYTLKAINSDPNYPEIVQILTLAHEWFGMRVPGSRAGGGPGPDHAYHLIPISHGARYEITGQRLTPPAGYCVYTLVGNSALTMALANLEGSDVALDDSRRYRITIGPEPAEGRSNHIQTKPGTRFMFIRDCLADWREMPDARRIRRLDSPTTLPLGDNQIAELAAELMVDDVPAMFWWPRLFRGLPPNTMVAPFGSGAVGGLQSQMITFGHVFLPDDEAFVVTVTHGGAAFRDIVLHDYWFNTIGDYASRTSSLASGQSVPNPDGTVTYVIAHEDPGVHNWLDPTGLHELLVAHRWQGLPARDYPGDPPRVQSALARVADLDRVLPPDLPQVTTVERHQQLADRRAQYALRYVDE